MGATSAADIDPLIRGEGVEPVVADQVWHHHRRALLDA
jgi:hypothetical protein